MRSWLIQERTNRNLTQSQMAKELQISESYYAYIETGKRQKEMELSLASKLAETFGMTVQQIADLEKAEPESS